MTEDSSHVLIEARGVTLTQAGRRVLDEVDLRVHRREIVTLIGLNGAGKTSLVRVLLGLIHPEHGRVERASGLRIGYSPQHIHRDRTLPITVRGFLTLGARASAGRLRDVLAEVGAGGLLDSALADISGGELQRVLLARALLREPDLLVLDEPLSGVDVAGQSELYRLIADIRDRYGCGVLLVSHDLHVVMAATDTVVCLNRHICCTGHPHAVTSHPEFVTLFGAHVAESLAIYEHDHDHRHDASGAAVPLSAPARRAPRPSVAAPRESGE